MNIIILSLVIVFPFCICVYQYIMIRSHLAKMKHRFSRNNVRIKMIFSKLEALDKKMDAQAVMLANFDKQLPSISTGKDVIEHQYDRAKRMLKKDLLDGNEQQHILQSCNMTTEEIELLTDLFEAGEENLLFAECNRS